MIELNIGVDFSLIIVIVMMIELNIGANGCGFKSFRQIKFCFGDITNQPSAIQIIRGERLDNRYSDNSRRSDWQLNRQTRTSLFGELSTFMVTYPAISYSDHQKREIIYSDLMMKTIWGRSDMIGLSSQKSLLVVVCFIYD